jgi:hypothetical protein
VKKASRLQSAIKMARDESFAHLANELITQSKFCATAIRAQAKHPPPAPSWSCAWFAWANANTANKAGTTARQTQSMTAASLKVFPRAAGWRGILSMSDSHLRVLNRSTHALYNPRACRKNHISLSKRLQAVVGPMDGLASPKRPATWTAATCPPPSDAKYSSLALLNAVS